MELPDFVNIEAKQGDAFDLSFIYTDDADVPIDVTGYSVEFSLAVSPGSTPAFSYSEADYITVGTTDGAFDIEVPYLITRTWTSRRYFYEVSIVPPDDKKVTVFEGKLSVRPEVYSE